MTIIYIYVLIYIYMHILVFIDLYVIISLVNFVRMYSDHRGKPQLPVRAQI